MATPSVGAEIDAWCIRCELVLAHTVEATVGTKIARVHCNTCKHQHAYRARRPGEKAPPRARRGAPAAPRPPDWATLVAGRDASSAKPYSTALQFERDALVVHPTFGLGVVTDARDGRRMEVLFESGSRTLLQGR